MVAWEEIFKKDTNHRENSLLASITSSIIIDNNEYF